VSLGGGGPIEEGGFKKKVSEKRIRGGAWKGMQGKMGKKAGRTRGRKLKSCKKRLKKATLFRGTVKTPTESQRELPRFGDKRASRGGGTQKRKTEDQEKSQDKGRSMEEEKTKGWVQYRNRS